MSSFPTKSLKWPISSSLRTKMPYNIHRYSDKTSESPSSLQQIPTETDVYWGPTIINLTESAATVLKRGLCPSRLLRHLLSITNCQLGGITSVGSSLSRLCWTKQTNLNWLQYYERQRRFEIWLLDILHNQWEAFAATATSCYSASVPSESSENFNGIDHLERFSGRLQWTISSPNVKSIDNQEKFWSVCLKEKQSTSKGLLGWTTAISKAECLLEQTVSPWKTYYTIQRRQIAKQQSKEPTGPLRSSV